MAHPIYQTEGIIIGGYEKGESSKTLVIITRRFGRIYAHAQNIRAVNSKLKNNLQVLSHVNLDLVNGRGYRIVGVEDASLCGQDKLDHSTFLRIMNLVKRFGGENMAEGNLENHEELFDDIKSLFYINKSEQENLEVLELLGGIRVMNRLGYWDGGDSDQILSGDIDCEKTKYIHGNYKKYLKMLNEAIYNASI